MGRVNGIEISEVKDPRASSESGAEERRVERESRERVRVSVRGQASQLIER